MVSKFDYNSDDVMKILNNPEYSDEQKKQLFEKYKQDLKIKRKNEIIRRINECAKENPIITQEDYINMVKKYNDDDLSKPFEIIESELNTFNESMKAKYQEYLINKEKENTVQVIAEEPKEEIIENKEENIEEVVEEDIMPSVNITNTNISNTLPTIDAKEIEPKEVDETPIFDSNNEVNEILPDQMEHVKEKGNASAIIVSIIAIILGIVIMYTIIKIK